MDDSLTRIFVMFKTKNDREVFWGMWFTKISAVQWATQELLSLENQTEDDPFVGFELVYTNVLTEQLGKRFITD